MREAKITYCHYFLLKACLSKEIRVREACLGFSLGNKTKKANHMCDPSAITRVAHFPVEGSWTMVLSTKSETLLSVSSGFTGTGNSGNSYCWLCRKDLLSKTLKESVAPPCTQSLGASQQLTFSKTIIAPGALYTA